MLRSVNKNQFTYMINDIFCQDLFKNNCQNNYDFLYDVRKRVQ